MGVLLVVTCTIYSCQTGWKPTEIYGFTPAECRWHDDKNDISIACDDEALVNYMLIRIDDYVDFRENYQCRLRGQRQYQDVEIPGMVNDSP